MKTSYKTKREQKRGEGSGKDYIPWILVGEYSGSGLSSRPYGIKTGREHHFLSNFEADLFYIFDLDDSIEDIREQFPLLDIEHAKELAEEAGIKYPPNRNNEPHVLTSDYFLNFYDGQEIAITIKPLNKLTKRQLELFEIERRYWNSKGIQWKLISGKEKPGDDFFLNYKDIHSSLIGYINGSYSDVETQEMLDCIGKHYKNSSYLSLPEFAQFIDTELEIKEGSTLGLFKIIIAKGLITTDLTKPLVSRKRKMKDLKFKKKDAKDLRKSDLAA